MVDADSLRDVNANDRAVHAVQHLGRGAAWLAIQPGRICRLETRGDQDGQEARTSMRVVGEMLVYERTSMGVGPQPAFAN